MKRFLSLTLLIFSAKPVFAQIDPATDSLAAPAAPLSIMELLQSAGWVIFPLILASIAAVSLIVFYCLTLREKNIVTADLLRRIDPLLQNEDWSGLAALVMERPEAVARVLDQTLKFLYRHKDADAEAIKAVAETEGVRLASSLNQRVLYLMDIGVLSPMLGLFGTVVGILRSFGSIAAEASPMRTMMLAGGVSQALVATAAGLIVGITSLFFYSFFRGRVQHLIALLESHSTVLVQELILLKNRHRIGS